MLEWRFSNKTIDYEHSLQTMQNRLFDIYYKNEKELIWFLEHNHVYTKGISALDEELLISEQENNIPILPVDRGGKYTYHGPGQRIVYAVIDLKKRNNAMNIKKYVHNFEQWAIDVLDEIGIECFRYKDMIGVWTKNRNSHPVKIVSLGIKIKKWIAYHGIAVNVNTNLSFFNKIIPCGIKNFNVTSIENEGYKITSQEIDYLFYKKRSSFL